MAKVIQNTEFKEQKPPLKQMKDTKPNPYTDGEAGNQDLEVMKIIAKSYETKDPEEKAKVGYTGLIPPFACFETYRIEHPEPDVMFTNKKISKNWVLNDVKSYKRLFKKDGKKAALDEKQYKTKKFMNPSKKKGKAYIGESRFENNLFIMNHLVPMEFQSPGKIHNLE